MPIDLESIHAANKALVQGRPLVAVFFGGNSGIGHYTLRELCRVTAENGGRGFHAYMVGRNSETAAEVIAECRGIYPDAQITFVRAANLSLIQDVDQTCAEIVRLVKEHGGPDVAIDYLMLSHAGSIFLPRKDTSEGIDETMSLMYYSRMRIILKLLPLLLNSQPSATVVSVYVAGKENKLFPDDLSVRDLSHYNYSQARSHMCYMHTLFFESLAQQHPGKLSLVHIFPGVVFTPAFQNQELPSHVKFLLNWIMIPFFWWLAVKPEVCGARMLSLASPRYPPGPSSDELSRGEAVTGTNGKRGSGAYSLTYNTESNYNSAAYESFDKEQMREKVWNHTLRAFEVIEKGEVFQE